MPAANTRTRTLSFAFGLALLTASLADAATVTGTVVDENGSAVSGALVSFANEADPTHLFESVTGGDGSYEVDLEFPTLASVVESTPDDFDLYQNYPNPFNPGTVIPYSVAEGGQVSLVVYNSLGQQVRTLVSGHSSPGTHEVLWDATDDAGRGVSAGVYFYQLRADRFAKTGKMVLIDGSGASPTPSVARVLTPAWQNGVGKVLALPALYTVTVTGSGFFDYTRSGIALTTDSVIDVQVNGDGDSGILRLGLTDAPVDGADAVRLTVSSIDIRRAGSDDGPWQSFAAGRTIDLLALQGVAELLGEQVLESGPVSGIRLIIESAEIDIDGETFELDVPSGAQSGLKLQGDFELVPGEILDLTMDFDARRSIVRQGQGNNFLLRPVVRLMSTPETGAIAGRVDVSSNLQAGGGGGSAPISLSSDGAIDGVGAGDDVVVVVDADNIADVRQLDIIVDVDPPGAFDLAATSLAAPTGFVSPGNEVLSDSQVRLGAASLQGIVTVDGTLGTITLKTASDFSGQATVTVSLISLGPSTSDRTEYDADDLGIAVGVNGATTGGVADFTSLEVAVVALSGGQEVTSARVDPDTGDYRLSYLPAGTYDVQIEATDGLVGSPEVASGVVVVAGEETGDVDFSLSGTPSE